MRQTGKGKHLAWVLALHALLENGKHYHDISQGSIAMTIVFLAIASLLPLLFCHSQVGLAAAEDSGPLRVLVGQCFLAGTEAVSTSPD